MNNNLHIIGDVYLDRPFNISPDIGNYIFNLEYPISTRGEPLKNKVNLRQTKSYIFETFQSYPLGVCLANNHIFDYGIEAFEDTLSFLESNKINYFGAGLKSANFNNPFIYSTKFANIALLAYCTKKTGLTIDAHENYGVSLFEKQRIIDDIKTCKKKADKVICILHDGEEEIGFPSPEEINQAHDIIESGADMIIYHHPHVIRPFEIFKGKEIFYSIGNFIFPDLNMKTYWNGSVFTRNLRKKQSKKNRVGLVVGINDHGELSEVYKSLQQKNNIALSRFTPENMDQFLNSTNYKTFYKKYYKQERRKQLIRSFVTNPRLPKPASVKELFS